MQAFADLVRQGKVLYIGVSEWNAEQIREGHRLAQELGVHLVSNQPQYSMLWRVIEGEVIPTSRELGVSQIVFSPIAQGVLTGKYRPGAEPPSGSRATDAKGGADMIKRFLNDPVLEAVQKLQPIADEVGVPMANLAVAWVLANDNVAGAIVGASRPEQITSNAQASGTALDQEVLRKIDEALGNLPETSPGKTESPASRPA
jgi:aryl-alcohol dehydrogenase-like predicted oxidoreductase